MTEELKRSNLTVFVQENLITNIIILFNKIFTPLVAGAKNICNN